MTSFSSIEIQPPWPRPLMVARCFRFHTNPITFQPPVRQGPLFGSIRDTCKTKCCKYGGFCSDLCNRFVLTILEFHIVNITAHVTLECLSESRGQCRTRHHKPSVVRSDPRVSGRCSCSLLIVCCVPNLAGRLMMATVWFGVKKVNTLLGKVFSLKTESGHLLRSAFGLQGAHS